LQQSAPRKATGSPTHPWMVGYEQKGARVGNLPGAGEERCWNTPLLAQANSNGHFHRAVRLRSWAQATPSR
jgi:hypothetical protein